MSAAPSRARHPSRCACSRVSIAPRVNVATRLPMRAEGCSNSSWHSLCFRRAVTSIAKMGEILYPFVKHRKTVSVAPEECAPPIFDFPSDSDSDRRLRRPAAGALEPASRGPRITFSRTNFTLPPTRYAGHRNLVSPLFARMRSPRVRGIYSARALRALSVERAPVVFFRNTRRRRSILLVFSRRKKHAPDLCAERDRAGREHAPPGISSLLCAMREEAAVRTAGCAMLAPHAPGFLSISSSDLRFPRRTAR